MVTSSILIVDDEIIIARELEARLISMGYEVAGIASSGAEAIRLAAETQPSLVLMDIVLKGDMDGIEAAAEIRRRQQVPVIYLTAYTDARTLERAMVTEPFGYIVKPFSERELNANIQMAIYKHRTELRLRRVERWFAAAIDELADAVVATDRDGRITVFNPAAEAITEWSRDEAIGRKLEEVLRLVNRSNGEPLLLSSVLQGPVAGPVVCLADDTLLIDRQERSIPVDCTTSYMRDDDGRPTGTISVFRDPTGKRHGALVTVSADVALAASEAVTLRGMLQICTESIVRNLHAAFARIWTVNTTGEMLLLQASSGMFTRLDDTYSKIKVGESRIGMIARERRPHLTNDVLSDPHISDQAWMHRERMVSFAGYPLLIDDRLVGVMGMFSRHSFSEYVLDTLGSVTRTIAVGIERKRLEEQLRQAQKMEAIGQLAGGIAHDFNNLLTIIAGYSQILLRNTTLNDDAKGVVGQIAQAGERATALTRQLLAFSRQQVMEPKTLDLNELIANHEKMLRPLIGEGISFSTVLDPTIEQVTVDPGQIEQVIMNVVINASDAMPDGGQLSIETRSVELDENFTQSRPTVKAGRYVLLAISDTGHGMTPDVLGHIFEPFFTTKEPGKGTGLGLATAYGIVRQSGGHIEVYSELGIGTTFKIYFPAVGVTKSAEKDKDGVDPIPGGSETILLIEDENAVRALARYILQECGYTVFDAADGDEAIEIFEQHGESIDLVVTDVVLPGRAGRRIAEQITQVRPGIKILYISGYTDDAVIRHGLLRAEISFLQKPFTPNGLASKVREVLDMPQTAS